MSIYDSKGNSLESTDIVNSSGISIDTAYDMHGDVIYSNTPSAPVSFRIMSYNVGSWYGYGNAVPAQYGQQYYDMNEDIFDTCSPDFVGLQEYYSKIGNLNAQELIMQTDPYFYGVDKTSAGAGRAFASKFQLMEPRDTLFSTQDGGEARYYLKAYIYVGGRKICVISAHTSYSGDYPFIQCNELLNVVAKEKYFIVVGDMNVRIDELHSTNYDRLNGVWESKGYNSASGEQFGIQKTFRLSGADGTWHGIDQIFTSSNITIDSVIIDDMKTDKYRSLTGNTHIDHCPLIANVTIN